MPHIDQMKRLRLFHSFLGISVIVAYFSTEFGRYHAIIGYVVAVLILVRILMLFSGAPQLGLMRFYPHFSELRLDHFMTQPAISKTLLLLIAMSLLTVTSTGLVMDNGRTLNRLYLTATGKAPPPRAQKPVVKAEASHINTHKAKVQGDENDEDDDEDEDSILGEIHEISGNLLMFLVAAHVCYLFVFKRPLASYMVFIVPKTKPNSDKSDPK